MRVIDQSSQHGHQMGVIVHVCLKYLIHVEEKESISPRRVIENEDSTSQDLDKRKKLKKKKSKKDLTEEELEKKRLKKLKKQQMMTPEELEKKRMKKLEKKKSKRGEF